MCSLCVFCFILSWSSGIAERIGEECRWITKPHAMVPSWPRAHVLYLNCCYPHSWTMKSFLSSANPFQGSFLPEKARDDLPPRVIRELFFHLRPSVCPSPWYSAIFAWAPWDPQVENKAAQQPARGPHVAHSDRWDQSRVCARWKKRMELPGTCGYPSWYSDCRVPW